MLVWVPIALTPPTCATVIFNNQIAAHLTHDIQILDPFTIHTLHLTIFIETYGEGVFFRQNLGTKRT